MKNKIIIGMLLMMVLFTTSAMAYKEKEKVQVNCNTTIMSDAVLTTNLSCYNLPGITIGASSITLDCQGHSITGGGIWSHGIYADGKNGITIKNCEIKNFLGQGIVLMSSSNSLIKDNIIKSNLHGIAMAGDFNCQFTGNTISSHSERGILVGYSSGNTFWDNTFSNNLNSNVYEYFSNGNFYNSGTIGNIWDDYSGTGYYYIAGEGDGVDYYPRGTK